MVVEVLRVLKFTNVLIYMPLELANFSLDDSNALMEILGHLFFNRGYLLMEGVTQ